MSSGDDPLSLVPPGDDGWSPEILRVAADRPGCKEREMPWLLLEPARARRERVGGAGAAPERGADSGERPGVGSSWALRFVGANANASAGEVTAVTTP